MDELTQKTLAWVNQIRAKQKQKPLTDLKQGQPGRHNSCPIAMSLYSDQGIPSVGPIIVIYHRPTRWWERLFGASWWFTTTADTPPDVEKWLRAFDSGEYSEYISY